MDLIILLFAKLFVTECSRIFQESNGNHHLNISRVILTSNYIEKLDANLQSNLMTGFNTSIFQHWIDFQNS